jgi:hypothetical protein
MAEDARLIGTKGNLLKLVKASKLSDKNRSVSVGESIIFEVDDTFWQGDVLFSGGNLQIITPSISNN